MFLDQLGAAGCPQIWPRGAQIGQKCPKIAISSSGGPKRLEQHGTKVEQVRGGPCRSFWTNLVQQGAPKFDQNWPKMPKNGNFKVSVVQKFGPLGQVWGQFAPLNWPKNFGLGLPYLFPTSFHAVPAVPDHRNSQIGISRHFLAVLGAPGPKLGAPPHSQLV